MPPPQSQLVKQYGLWSRPLPPCDDWHPAELGRPEDDRVVEQAEPLQVGDQGRAPRGPCRGERAVVALDVLVASPSCGAGSRCRCRSRPARTARRARAAGGRPGTCGRSTSVSSSGLISLSNERLAVVEAVELEHLRRLLREVERLRGGELHLGGQLVALDAGLEPVVAGRVSACSRLSSSEQVDAGRCRRRG